MTSSDEEERQQELSGSTTRQLYLALDRDLKSGWDQLGWARSTMNEELVGIQIIRLLREVLYVLRNGENH